MSLSIGGDRKGDESSKSIIRKKPFLQKLPLWAHLEKYINSKNFPISQLTLETSFFSEAEHFWVIATGMTRIFWSLSFCESTVISAFVYLTRPVSVVPFDPRPFVTKTIYLSLESFLYINQNSSTFSTIFYKTLLLFFLWLTKLLSSIRAGVKSIYGSLDHRIVIGWSSQKFIRRIISNSVQLSLLKRSESNDLLNTVRKWVSTHPGSLTKNKT